MSNTRTPTAKPEQNGQTEAEDKAVQQAAQKAEAGEQPTKFTFGGYDYEIPPDQPSWTALDYVSRFSVDDDNMALIPAVKEMIGPEQWALAASRHRGDQLGEFFQAMNRAAGGNA